MPQLAALKGLAQRASGVLGRPSGTDAPQDGAVAENENPQDGEERTEDVDLEKQEVASEAGESQQGDASVATGRFGRLTAIANSRVVGKISHAFIRQTSPGAIRRRQIYRQGGIYTRRQQLLSKIKDPAEKSRLASLRKKMKLAKRKKKDDDELPDHLGDGAKEEEVEMMENKGNDDGPEEGELLDVIEELSLTVEPNIEMMGDPWLVEQRKAGTLNVKSEKVIQHFKRHKAMMGKILFEAENGNNMACEQFLLGDIDGAHHFFARALHLSTQDKKPAALEMDDLRRFINERYQEDVDLFYGDLTAGEWRSAVGRRRFIDGLKRMEYWGNPERLFCMVDSMSHDGKISVAEISALMKMKVTRLAEMDYDIPERGIILNNIACCQMQKGDVLGGLAHLRESMAILVQNAIVGHDDPRVQRVMGNIAVCYIRVEDYDTALDHLARLQELRERRLGSLHDEVLTVLFHIGFCFLAKSTRFKIIGDCQRMDGQIQEKPVEFNLSLALCAFKERLQRQQDLLKEKEAELEKLEELAADAKRNDRVAPVIDRGEADQLRLDIARSQEVVSGVHEHAGQSHRAVIYLRQAVEAREEILSETDPEVMSAWNTLATTCLKIGEPEEALVYVEKSTLACAALFGETSVTVAAMLGHTGMVLFKLGSKQLTTSGSPDVSADMFAEALDKLGKARDMQAVLLGEESPEVASTIHAIGSVHLVQGERVDARKCFEDALMKRIAILGRTAIATASSAHALGALYARTPRRNEEAIQLLQKACVVRERRLGETSLYLADSLHEHGCALLKRHTVEAADQALSLLARGAKIREKRLGMQNLIYASSMHQVGQAHMHLGLYEEARLYLQAALDLREQLVGRRAAQTAVSHFGLGMSFYHLANYRKAMKHIKISYSIREYLFGMEHPLSADSLHEIGMVYVRKKMLESSLPFLKKSLDLRCKLNQRDATFIDEDSEEDERVIYRPESERQKRIRRKRLAKRTQQEKESKQKAKEEEKARITAEKLAAKVAADKEKKKIAKKKRKEAAARRAANGGGLMHRIMSHLHLSRRPALNADGIAKADGEEESESSEEEEEEAEKGSKGSPKSRTSSKSPTRTSSKSPMASPKSPKGSSKSPTSPNRSPKGSPKNPMMIEDGQNEENLEEGEEDEVVSNMDDADEDSEVDVSELGIDVRGWLAGTIGKDMYILAKVFMELKDYIQAKYYLDRSICLREEVFGGHSAEMAEVLHLVGVFFVQQEQRHKALGYLIRALGVREHVCGHHSADTADTEIQLGEALADVGQPDEAIVHLSRGCGIREALFGMDDPLTKHLREKWAGLASGATFYDPVPEGETLPHFARRSPESFLHGYADRTKMQPAMIADTPAADAAPAEESNANPDNSFNNNVVGNDVQSNAEEKRSSRASSARSGSGSDAGSQASGAASSKSGSKSATASGSKDLNASAASAGLRASNASAASIGSGGLRASASAVSASAASGDLKASAASGGLPAAAAASAASGGLPAAAAASATSQLTAAASERSGGKKATMQIAMPESSRS